MTATMGRFSGLHGLMLLSSAGLSAAVAHAQSVPEKVQSTKSQSEAQTAQAPQESANSITGTLLLRGYTLTPAQKLVQDLPPPQPGGRFPPVPLNADSPMPSSDPHDLRGTWYHNQDYESRIQRDMYGYPVPFTMAGAKILARRVTAENKGTPYLNPAAICRPPGPFAQRDINFPFQVFQSKNSLEFVFEEYHGRWDVALNAPKTVAQKQYMGHSIGHWESDTLIVETSGFKASLWLEGNGTPISKNAKLVDRVRKINFGDGEPYLEIVTTIVDPIYYTKPWSVVRVFMWNPGMTLFHEYDCEEQIGDPSERPDAGLIPEIED